MSKAGHNEHKKSGCFSQTADWTADHTFTTPKNLQERQLEVYTTVKHHYENNNPTPLCMIVTGTAGTGYLHQTAVR